MPTKRRDSKGRVLRNGEVQREDGKYMYRYTDTNGKRQTVYSWKLVETDKVPDGKRCSMSLRELEKQIQRDIDDGILAVDANKRTVNDQFLSFIKLRTDLRETTRCNYICLYDKHVNTILGQTKLCSVKFSDIQKLYIQMIQEHGLKVSTVRSVHSILYQMFEGAVMDGLIRANPTANVLKSLKKTFSSEQKKRHALTEEEQARFVDYIYGSPLYRRWGSLFTVLLGTGMRIGEALGLRWGDCDFKHNTISVNHTLLYKDTEAGGYQYRISEPKTKAGIRTIPMFSDVRSALLAEKKKKRSTNHKAFTIDGYTDFVFLNSNGRVFTPGHVFEVIRNITYDYNQEEQYAAQQENREPCLLPAISAHILRHTFCTRMCENEPNIKIVQDVMGHRNVRTTMDVYNEATAVRKQMSFQNLEGKLKLS